MAKSYGIYYKKTPQGDVDHTFLTSLVDQNGILRVHTWEFGSIPTRCCAIYGALLRRRKRDEKKESFSRKAWPEPFGYTQKAPSKGRKRNGKNTTRYGELR